MMKSYINQKDLLKNIQKCCQRSLWFCFENESLVIGEVKVMFSTRIGNISVKNQKVYDDLLSGKIVFKIVYLI